jgi:hypothetical protein
MPITNNISKYLSENIMNRFSGNTGKEKSSWYARLVTNGKSITKSMLRGAFGKQKAEEYVPINDYKMQFAREFSEGSWSNVPDESLKNGGVILSFATEDYTPDIQSHIYYNAKFDELILVKCKEIASKIDNSSPRKIVMEYVFKNVFIIYVEVNSSTVEVIFTYEEVRNAQSIYNDDGKQVGKNAAVSVNTETQIANIN